MTLQQILYAVTIAETGSINSAANKLYVSQSCLSSAIRDLEREFRISLFVRTNRGVIVTPDGEEFLGYARQMLEQYRLMQDKYLEHGARKRRFVVSLQHYSFAVQAFINTIREYSADEYEFAVYETRTETVIDNVKNLRSEIGVLYVNDFNRSALGKIFHDSEVDFVPLFDCPISVYLWRSHPLARRDKIAIEELMPYPNLSFDQGKNNSFYYAEEALSAYPYRQVIKASDRATMLNLMVGLNGYTLCSGLICEELNGNLYKTVPLATDEKMTIGYVKKTQIPLSEIGAKYVERLRGYGEKSDKRDAGESKREPRKGASREEKAKKEATKP